MTPIKLEDVVSEETKQLSSDIRKMYEDKYHLIPKGFEISKRMNDINTFQCCDGELYLRGVDEFGEDFSLCFDAYNFLEWIDTEQIKYIKKQIIKHIKNK